MAVRATGRVVRIYATRGHTYIRLDAGPKPQDGYFRLDQTHSNYNALYSLALSAAINRDRLQIRTSAEIVPTEYAAVAYMVVDW